MYQWNKRRKNSIPPKGKELLVQTVLENEAFNATKKSEGLKDKGKMTAREKKNQGVTFVKREDMPTGHVKAERSWQGSN